MMPLCEHALKIRLLAILTAFVPFLAPAADRPNIVVFLSDDHTMRDSSVYNPDTEVRTPHMTRIAVEGMTFENAYVVSPSCAPSRAAMLTGLLPQHNGAEANHSRPRADIKKLPAYLHKLGYEVVAFGKIGHYKQTLEYGFDLALHLNYHEDIAIPKALEWLEARKSDKPLCLFVGTNWPHVPWPKESPGYDPDKIGIPVNYVDTKATREYRARYYAAVTQMDTELGRVYDLAREKLGDDTFFLHTSDHGAQWPFGKWTLYDEGIRTPFIVSWPGKIKPGSRTKAMVSWLDILPTLIDVAGGQAPAGLDGSSILPVLRGEKEAHRSEVFTTHSGDGDFNVFPTRAVSTADGWKYIRNLHPEFRFTSHVTKATADSGYWTSWVEKAVNDADAMRKVWRYQFHPTEELYFPGDDPFEERNLADDPKQAEILVRLRGLLDDWLIKTGDKQSVFGKPTKR